LLLLAGQAPAVQAGDLAATWQRHEIDFTYVGFTTRYSCEGLRDKLRVLLEASGAQPGFRITARSCGMRYGNVTKFPAVKLVFHTAALPSDGSAAAGEPTPARWQKVVLKRRQPRQLDPGDCELVEQFRDRILPAFTTRHVDADINCIPHQLSGSSFVLQFETLAGLPAADAARRPR
jgi:hypothetical protein